LHKLPLLDGWNEQRREAARLYAAALDGVGDLRLPKAVKGSDPVWHLYVVRTGRPVELAEFLRTREILTGRHYPEAPHLSPAYAHVGHRPGSFPIAEAISNECLSLPMFPEVTETQIERVAGAVAEYFSG
jgi:dTDP-4-amino-4,6-dideoxygalactose transaminase